jgi:hypothetical protein
LRMVQNLRRDWNGNRAGRKPQAEHC